VGIFVWTTNGTPVQTNIQTSATTNLPPTQSSAPITWALVVNSSPSLFSDSYVAASGDLVSGTLAGTVGRAPVVFTAEEENAAALLEAALVARTHVAMYLGPTAAEAISFTGNFSSSNWSLSVTGQYAGTPLLLSYSGVFDASTSLGNLVATGTIGSAAFSASGSWSFQNPGTNGVTMQWGCPPGQSCAPGMAPMDTVITLSNGQQIKRDSFTLKSWEYDTNAMLWRDVGIFVWTTNGTPVQTNIQTSATTNLPPTQSSTPITWALVVNSSQSLFSDSYVAASGDLVSGTLAGTVGRGPGLTVTYSAGSLVISWSDPLGVLETAQDIAGPWLEVAGATSPYAVVPHSQTRQFFRLAVLPP
jgi:hypothetical protein